MIPVEGVPQVEGDNGRPQAGLDAVSVHPAAAAEPYTWEHLRACLSPHISTHRQVNQTPIEVLGVRLFRRDAVVVKGIAGGVVPASRRGGGFKTRGKIEELSKRSLLRMLHELRNSPVEFVSMGCLTYPREFPADGRIVKRHLNAFLVEFRRRFPGADYAWFLEFQERGAPHLHFFATVRPDRKWLASTWFRVVASGDERHLRAGTSWDVLRVKDGALRYAAKYAAKAGQKIVPEGFANVGRFWGCSRNVKAEPVGFVPCHEMSLLDALKRQGTKFLAPHRTKLWWRQYLWDCSETIAAAGDLEHRAAGGNGRGYSRMVDAMKSREHERRQPTL